METNTGKKGAKLALIITFCAAIGLLFVLLMVLPKHAGEISPLEFRQLANYPIRGKSAETLKEEIVKSKFSQGVDKFLEDHFPGRSFFIALDSYGTRLTGRNSVKPVVWGRGGRLYDAPLTTDYEQLYKNLDKLDAFAAENGMELTYAIVPPSSVECEKGLPMLHLDYPEAKLDEVISGHSSSQNANLTALYKAAVDPDSCFYRTDHHWTMTGAYACYDKLCGMWGEKPLQRGDFSVKDYEFFGSFYREAGLWLTEPDRLEVWRNPLLDSMKVTLNVEERGDVRTGVFDDEKLNEEEVDKYAAYLYSNNGLTVIENPQGNGKSLMIVKDSYGNSIATLFAMNYSTVIMVDTRYYSDPALPMPSEVAARYGAERVVVIMGAESILADCGLVYMR